MKGKEESGWLIEHPNMAYIRYVTLDEGEIKWSGSYTKALRFSRKIDAEQFCETFMLGFGRVADHLFNVGA